MNMYVLMQNVKSIILFIYLFRRGKQKKDEMKDDIMKEFVSNMTENMKTYQYPKITPLITNNSMNKEQIPPNIGLEEELNIDETISEIITEIELNNSIDL